MKALAWLGVAGVAGLGLWSLGAAVSAPATPAAGSWVVRVLAAVSAHEGGYGSCNPNTDGAGLSYGILQWTQASGNLGRLLAAMAQADPAQLAQSFGPAARELLAVTQADTSAARLGPVGGVLLWREPWLGRFRAAGQVPVFQQVQDRLALQGEHMQAALAVAQQLGVPTERALALFFDTAVQQGPHGARRVAERVVAALQAQGAHAVEYGALLSAYAAQAAAPFRRQSPPSSSRYTWKPAADGTWHAWVGSVDLYADITRRRGALLVHPGLGDTWLI